VGTVLQVNSFEVRSQKDLWGFKCLFHVVSFLCGAQSTLKGLSMRL